MTIITLLSYIVVQIEYFVGLIIYLLLAFGIRMTLYLLFLTLVAFMYCDNKGFLFTLDVLYRFVYSRLIFIVLWLLTVLLVYLNGGNLMAIILEHYTSLFIEPILTVTSSTAHLFLCEFLLPLVVKTALCDSMHTGDYIPWSYTQQMDKGITALNRMYSSLEVGSPLHLFISDKCAHLLDTLKGHTGIPTYMVDTKYLLNNNATVSLGNNYSARYTRHLVDKTGIYIFMRPEDDTISYCGSSLNFTNRIRGHYLDMQRFNKPFYTDVLDSHGGFSGYLWNPIHKSTNYLSEYLNKVGHVPVKDKVILDSFTQQEIRSLEQAVSTYAKPIYYKGYPVSMSHTNWHSGHVPVSSIYSMSTTWVTELGEVYKEDSLAQASKTLGLYVARIKQIANCIEDTYVDSPNFGKVQIYVQGLPTIQQPVPWTMGSKPDIQGIDMSNLVPNKIYLLDSNKQLLSHGPFDNSTLVNKALGLPDKMASRHWVNKDYIVKSPLLGISVYLICNKVSKLMPGLVTNLMTGDKRNFPSMNSAIASIKPPMDFSNFIYNYVLKGKPYISGDSAYLVEYEHVEDHLRKEELMTAMFKKAKVKSNAKYYAKMKAAKDTQK